MVFYQFHMAADIFGKEAKVWFLVKLRDFDFKFIDLTDLT